MNVRLTATEKVKVLNGDDLFAIMQKVLLREDRIGRNKEHFWLVSLNNAHRILNIELISLGGVNATSVEPMEVFSVALQKRSVRVVMVHNHPSGEVRPSPADVDLTDRLYQIGQFLQVPVIDHLIITERSYFSFADTGLLDQVKLSKKYVIPYKEQERLLKEARDLGVDHERRRVAAQLKAKGLSMADIAEVTSLSEEQVKWVKLPVKKSSLRTSGKVPVKNGAMKKGKKAKG